MKRTVIRSCKAVVCILAAAVLIVSCAGARPDPVDTVKTFGEYLNAFDVEGCTDLLAPKLAGNVESSMNLSNMLTGALTGIDIDSSSLILMIPMLTQFASLAGYGLDLPQWEFANFTTSQEGDKAVINCDVLVRSGNSQPDRYPAYFELSWISGKWMISDMR